jgi:hypothetical protein
VQRCTSWLPVAASLLSLVPPDTAAASSTPQFGRRDEVFAITPGVAGGFLQELRRADLTGDGLEDLVLTHAMWQTEETFPITILVNDGNGDLVDRTTALFDGPVTATQFPRQTVLEDFNGDGRLDILIADHGYDAEPFPGFESHLALSTADGRWRDASANLPRVKRFTHSATAGDVDGDGDADVVLGHLGAPIELLLNDGTGRFGAAPSGSIPATATDRRWTRVELVDVIGGGAPDLVLLGDQFNDRSILLQNDGDGRFTEVVGALPAEPFGAHAIGTAVRAMDLDGDDRTDLVLAFTKSDPSYRGRWLQVLVNDGDGTFTDETASRLPQTDNLEQWAYNIELGDLDRDGDDDLGVDLGSPFCCPNTAWVPPVYLNDGAGRFAPVPASAFAEPPYGQLVFSDVDGDARLDIVSAWQTAMRQPERVFVSIQRAPAGARRYCADPVVDRRDAGARLPKQGVVVVDRRSPPTYAARSIDGAGALVPIDLAGHVATTPIVAAWQTPATCLGGRGGGWAATPLGEVVTDGRAAPHHGDMRGARLNRPVVGMSPTASGDGYWLVAGDGGIFTFGDASFLGSTGAIRLNQPVVAMASTPSGRGYWLAASDGGIFTFGDAAFLGSMGATRLQRPVVGMIPTTSGRGYWLVASDGGIFTFGDATFRGSTGASPTRTPIVGMIPNGAGYTVVEEDGTLHRFG